MERLAAGEDSVLGDLMQRWAPRVQAYFLRLTGSETVAQDLAEETFVRLYQTRARFQPGTPPHAFSTWLFGIAANLGREHLRWKKRHPTSPLEEEPDALEPDSPESLAESRETVEAVRFAISQLPEDLREAVLLSEYEEMSHAEIASVVGCTPKAVERRLSRARERLRQTLSRWL
jgi:RNA polymerase sigma factor (sigma-70 family)